MLKILAPIIFAISLIFLGVSIGFFASNYFTNTSQLFDTASPAADRVTDTGEGDRLYSSQTASIRGIITAKDNSSLTVKNLNSQATGTIPVSNRLTVANSAQTSDSTASNELSKVELNKEALISLEKIDGKYQVVSIQYIIPAPSLPPIVN